MLKKGDSVKVKAGIIDPDYNRYDMSDWQGRILSVENDEESGELLYEIQWDSITLESMPDEFITNSISDGCDYSSMILGEPELIEADVRDRLEDVEQLKKIIDEAHFWEGYGEQGKRIKSVLSQCADPFDLYYPWFEYLEDNLEIPCKVIYKGEQAMGLKYGGVIELTGILDCDDLKGVIGCGKINRKTVNFPLCDVKPETVTFRNQALEDYTVWFANQ